MPNEYYDMRRDALAESTDANVAIVKALLALAEQVRGLREDLAEQ